MPVYWNGTKLQQAPITRSQTVFEMCPGLKDVSNQYKYKELKTLDKNVLYVSQHEFAVLDPICRGEVQYIASDSATTCHIAVLIHPDSKTVGLAHFDTSSTRQGVTDLLACMNERWAANHSGQERGESEVCRFQLYIFGGFCDSRGISERVSLQLINAFHQQPFYLELRAACIVDLNTEERDSVVYPVIYGVGVDLNTFEINRVRCLTKGPDAALRCCRTMCGAEKMIRLYNNELMHIEITPFDYEHSFTSDEISIMLNWPTKTLLQNTSTSPAQEPPEYAADMKEALALMRDHPAPRLTLFGSGRSRCYKLMNGHWHSSQR